VQRVLALALAGLSLTSCTAYRVGYRELHGRLETLQNPKHRGDANTDLVPYQARNRDAAECNHSKDVQAAIDSVELPPESNYPSGWAMLEDPAVWRAMYEPFFACMEAKGWQPR
jgi:hypothetical protein